MVERKGKTNYSRPPPRERTFRHSRRFFLRQYSRGHCIPVPTRHCITVIRYLPAFQRESWPKSHSTAIELGASREILRPKAGLRMTLVGLRLWKELLGMLAPRFLDYGARCARPNSVRTGFDHHLRVE